MLFLHRFPHPWESVSGSPEEQRQSPGPWIGLSTGADLQLAESGKVRCCSLSPLPSHIRQVAKPRYRLLVLLHFRSGPFMLTAVPEPKGPRHLSFDCGERLRSPDLFASALLPPGHSPLWSPICLQFDHIVAWLTCNTVPSRQSNPLSGDSEAPDDTFSIITANTYSAFTVAVNTPQRSIKTISFGQPPASRSARHYDHYAADGRIGAQRGYVTC